MTDNLHLETLPPNTAKLINILQSTSPDFLSEFYLSGGTALSLQIGHRQSEDLDFFNQHQFNPETLQQKLVLYGDLKQTELAKGTLNTFLNDVKLQFLEYPYDLLESTVQWGSIKLSSVADIACTKLQTVAMRGSKKDFIDLYYLLERYSLVELFALLEKKYHHVEYSKTHIMKSLVYFEDANNQPMPRMLMQTSWEEVKYKMISIAKAFNFE